MTGTDLGRQIETLRDRAGLTRYALGKQSGVDTSYLTRLESGQIENPSFFTVAKIAEVLDVKLDALKTGKYLEKSPK